MKPRVALLAASLAALVLLSSAIAAASVSPPPTGPPGAVYTAETAPANVTTSDVFVWTSLSGTGGVYLYVPSNSTGVLTYPTWHAELLSASNATYAVYVNGLEVASGSSVGVRAIQFNVTGSPVTVLVGFAGQTYQFRNEIVAAVSVQTYYTSPPAPLVYTAQQFENALLSIQVQVYAVLFLAFIGSFFMARKIVILNSEVRARRVL